MFMKEDLIRELLKLSGARRAAQGVIVKGLDGYELHITDAVQIRKGFSIEEASHLAFCTQSEIIRLRELRTSHDYLLRLRVNAIAEAPRSRRVMIARREKYEARGRRWSLTQYYHGMDGPQRAYIKLLPRSDQRRVKAVPSGFALMNEANALCIKSLLGEVVVASEALRHFYYFMTIGFFGDMAGIKMDDRLVALLIAARIMIGSEALDFDLDPRGTLPANVEKWIQNVIELQTQFTFGHEYAHYLGHLSSSEVDLSTPADSIKAKTFSLDAEYAADFAAIDLVANNGARTKLARAGYAVLLYLSFLQAMTILPEMTRFSLSTTHPDPRERIRALCLSLGKKSPLDRKALESAIDTVDQYSTNLLQRMQDEKGAWTVYGSIYLPSYTTKMRRDRTDF
jgi:hypothetical protein